MALKLGFKSKAAALGLGALALSGAAYADDDQARQYAAVTTESPQQANFSTAASSTIAIVPFAGSRAVRWAADHDGIAVSVKLGTDRSITPEQIMEVLTNEFASAGVRNVVFYFEQNDIEATGLTYHYGKDGGASHGPYLLRDARAGAREAAAQHRFYLQNPELGM